MELSQKYYIPKFDENSDLSTTFLGRIDMTMSHMIKVKERYYIYEQGYTIGKLLDGTECQILLDTEASKSFKSKMHYLRCKSLHSLPKLASKTQKIQVGNGQYVSVLFIIPAIIDIHGHRFEICTLLSEIHEHVNLILGIKNILEFKGIINLRDSCFSFLNRSISFFPKEQVLLKPREQRFIKIEAPFIDEISGLVIVKVLDKKSQSRLMLKLKFVRNTPTLDATNSSFETMIFTLKAMSGILYLRSIRYYKIKHSVLQQNLSSYCTFKSADVLCGQFNKFVNTLKKEKEETNDQYPWLDINNERRNMSDKEILEKYMDLERLCLSESEKKEVMDMLYKHKDMFSLRDVIDTCPEIEVEIDVTDKSPVFLPHTILKKKIKLY